MKHKYLFILFIIFQTGIIAVMIIESLIPLWFGREIEIAVRAYDPRDIFRGNYVNLTHDFRNIDIDNIAHNLDTTKTYHFGDKVYVGFIKTGKYHEAVFVSQTKPPTNNDTVYMQAVVQYQTELRDHWSRTLTLKYGIESYFASPQKAKEIEDLLQNRWNELNLLPDSINSVIDTVSLSVMVGQNGKARIKQINWRGAKL